MRPLLIALGALSLFLIPSLATSQSSPTGQPAVANAPINVSLDSLRVTHNGFMAAISYTNTTSESLQITLAWPQEKNGFAADNLGNEYVLSGSIGMARRHAEPNADFRFPGVPAFRSIFLLAPLNQKALASYHFTRTTPQLPDSPSPSSFFISIGLFARPADPELKPDQTFRTFYFTAIITDGKPQ